ncbi:MAG TPA: hypothetical protein VFX95_05270 [Caulobacteraceae bacterium]|nr:hypothetical protein [Caulobacteraceae bacterium]
MIGTLARHAAAAVAAFFVGADAEAKPSTPAPPKPVNEAARLEAEKRISSAGAPELFLNETRDGAILIRHKASNFQCLFNPGGENALMVEAPRGDEIGCDGPTMLFHTTYFIKRAGQADSLDASYAHAVDEVKARWPKAMNIKVAPDANQEVLAKLAETAPPSKTSWFLARNGESWAFTRVSVAKVGEWLVTMRAAGPVESQDAAESLTEMLWLTRLMVMVDPALGPKPIVAEGGQKKR